jgi:hypothetical protein
MATGTVRQAGKKVPISHSHFSMNSYSTNTFKWAGEGATGGGREEDSFPLFITFAKEQKPQGPRDDSQMRK